MTLQKQTSRHGKQLEMAILTTVWGQINKVGYQELTIKEVAQLAHTNKNTVYRHWPNKAVLVLAACAQFGPKPKIQLSSIGKLRDDESVT